MPSKIFSFLPLQGYGYSDLLSQVSSGGPSQPAATANSQIAIAILLFGLILLLAQGGMFVLRKQNFGQQYTRLSGLTLIIVSAIFLVTTGFPQEQVSPAFALLGTIAGYLLKSGESKE